MDVTVVVVVAVIATIGVTALAPKVRVAAPLLLVALGVVASLLLAGPVVLDPEWVLGGILPPLLYSAAITVPATELRRDLLTVSWLSVVLVAVSAVAVGAVVAWVLPGVPLAAGIALGAALSPTDAVATSIVRRAGASPRIVTVLEGESLLNDASALVLLRAVVAAIGGAVSLGAIAGRFVLSLVAAVVVGVLVGRVNLWVRARLTQESLGVAVSLVAPFVAYLPTEHLGASGLVAAVTAGLVTGQGAQARLRPSDRLTERAVWGTVELLLESAVFLLMGLELVALTGDVESGGVTTALLVGALAAALVVMVRAAFVAPSLWMLHRRAARGPAVRARMVEVQGRIEDGSATLPQGRRALHAGPGGPDGLGRREGFGRQGAVRGQGRGGTSGRAPAGPRRIQDPARLAARLERFQLLLRQRIADLDYLAAQAFGPRDGVVLVWAGMRGAVTLAAAQSLPPEVPERSLLVLVAFVVAVGTLVVQGGTLPWLLRRLGLTGTDRSAERAERRELELTLRAAVARRIDELTRPDGSPFARDRLDEARRIIERGVAEEPEKDADRRALRLAIIRLQRDELLRLRDVGEYSSQSLDVVFAQLDADELGIELRET